jgi:hypothetical protein
MSSISWNSKYIDGRQVEARIAELENDVSDFEKMAANAGWSFRTEGDLWVAVGPEVDGSPGNVYTDESRDVVVVCAAEDAGARWADVTDVEELHDLRQLREEAQSYGGWPNCTLINEDNWVEYAQQYADDLGGVTDEWPPRHIDWDAAAEALREDYTEVQFSGSSFYVRT